MNKAVILFVTWNGLTFLLGNTLCFALLVGVLGVPATVLISEPFFLFAFILVSGIAGWLFLGGAKSLDWIEGENGNV